MNCTKYKLTLTIPVEVWSKTGHAVALCDAKKVLEDSGYEEGRYPFSREMVTHGLGLMLRHAVRESVLRLMEQKFGKDTMVKVPNGEMNKAFLEMEDWMRSDFGSVIAEGECWEVEVKPVWD